MARRGEASPYRENSYEDDYSEDFDDDDDLNDTGTKRYKTRSPIMRTDKKRNKASRHSESDISKIPKLSITESEAGTIKQRKPSQKTIPHVSKGDTYSNGSGYITPSEANGSEYYEAEKTKVTLRSAKPYKKSPRKATFVEYHTPRSLGSKVQHRSNRRGKGRGSMPNTGRSSFEPKFDNVAKRVMSARRHKINELMNQNNELKQQVIEIRDENRLLKKTQRRQDKALQRFDDQENELPTLIQRQNNEVRSLKDQIRKWREKFEKSDRYLRDAEDDLDKMKLKLKKLKTLADEKDLPERAELNRKLNQSEIEMEARDVKIRELEKHVKHLEKNHRHELGIERARQKEVNNQLLQLRDENEKLSTNVKEKEKEIQMKNIYANRMVKPPHRLPNSYNGTPHDTPPPRRRRPSEGDEMTPRDRAKQMELKRREELRRKRELKQRQQKQKRDNYVGKPPTPQQGKAMLYPTHLDNMAPRYPTHSDNMTPRSSRSPIRTERRLVHGNYVGRPLTPRQLYPTHFDNMSQTSARSTIRTEHAEKLKQEQETRKQREEEEQRTQRSQREDEERYQRRRREEEERELAEKERRLNDQAEREEDERRMKQERERMKRDAEDRERRERERKETEERDRKEKREREERERRERERKEQERRAQEDRRRVEEDETFQVERKKKDEILQKLREIDEGGQKGKEKDKHFSDPFFVTEGKEDSTDSMGSKKSYKFTRPIENMHKGKPARTSFTSGLVNDTTDKRKAKKETESVEIGGYNPSFGGKLGSDRSSGPSKPKTFSLFDDDEPKPSTTTAKPANKTKLLEDLFGSKGDNKSSNQDDIFAPRPPPKKATGNVNRSSFPWDDESNKSSAGTIKTKRENSSTLFGGGNAFVNDEDVFKSSQHNGSLNRRPKQPTTTFHTRPTVNAINDNFNDDDLEEVIL